MDPVSIVASIFHIAPALVDILSHFQQTYSIIRTLNSEKTRDWLKLKQSDLNNIMITGSLTAAVATASLSWPDIQRSFWLVRGRWYTSVIMVIASVLSAINQGNKMQYAFTKYTDAQLSLCLLNSRGLPSVKLVVQLQLPSLLLNLSLTFYAVGLAVLVFWHVNLGGDSLKIAILFGVACISSFVLFFMANVDFAIKREVYEMMESERRREQESEL